MREIVGRLYAYTSTNQQTVADLYNFESTLKQDAAQVEEIIGGTATAADNEIEGDLQRACGSIEAAYQALNAVNTACQALMTRYQSGQF